MKINYYQIPLQQISKDHDKSSHKRDQFDTISPIKLTSPIQLTTQIPQINTHNTQTILQPSQIMTQPQLNQNNQEWSPSNFRKSALTQITKKSAIKKNEIVVTYHQILQRKTSDRKLDRNFQATFKPKNAKNTINTKNRNISINNKSSQQLPKTNKIIKTSSKSKLKNMQKYLLGDGPVIAKTKYQQILEQHLAQQKNNKNKQNNVTQKTQNPKQTTSSIQISTKKTYKQNNNKYHNISNHKNNANQSNSKQSNNKQSRHRTDQIKANKSMFQPNKPKYAQLISNPSYLKQQSKQSQIKLSRNTHHKSLSKFNSSLGVSDYTKSTDYRHNIKSTHQNQHKLYSNGLSQSTKSGRWISMDFHERQRKVLESRKQKQKIGLQRKAQEQIKSCTFQPHIFTNKLKISKNQNQKKNSYLEQYFDRIHRKY